ncbi:glycoside hydrolase family 128 protein [Daedalea quercina L-15889]|uniref:Glycoside hydrolase family 128 protein n=1 Tax=Daedalea quercina L-15889 TaxID=1314783 RepID=A0A165RTX7_9APHY|nr:glycoside hydrolase family 128 protein [Daedalea quercina L-15889]
MKYTSTLVSLALLLAGSVVEAAHISNLHTLKQAQVHKRRSGASATYSVSTASATATGTPTSSASSAAVSATSSSSASGASFSSGIKRGLSFNDASLTEQFSAEQVSFAYNWGQTYSGSIPENVMYIPMLWSDSDSFTSTWSTNAQAAIDNGTEFLMGFNEPDLNTQANMTPEQAAQAWTTYMEPFAGKAKLVGPAITNGGAPMGETWLNEFIGNCTSCTIDVYAIHIYDSATNEAYYKSYISDFASTYGKTTWVTEFGATGSDSDIQTFLGDMVSYLDGLDGVGAYAWFMDEVGNLVNSDGSLTTLAETYVS